ncbi:MAG TPA: hypothetical protein ENJ16_01875 [Planctomycetaceae bacterium]|nr:hypothetical protein [Planctomycetaceae bacterium]
MIDREDLLGYLLGALDAEESARVEAAVRNDVALRQELRELQDALQPLEEERDAVDDPPPGLAERTLRYVEAHRAIPRPVMARPTRSRWIDAVATIASVGILALLLFPTLLNSRFRARVHQCQSNLLALGTQLMSYADAQPDRSYPPLAESGRFAFAGAPAVELAERGLLDRQTRLLLCPATRVSVGSWGGIPTRQAIETASEDELERLQARAGGSYGWYLGVVCEGRFRAPRHRGRSFFVIASDAPSSDLAHRASANHGGVGWNVLYDDLHVDFIRVSDIELSPDDPTRNHLGMVAAGVGGNDSVVAPSGTPVRIIRTLFWSPAPPPLR